MKWDVQVRRVKQEWALLQDLAAANSSIEVLGREDGYDNTRFRICLRHTEGLVKSRGSLNIEDAHEMVISFPQFFPSVPLEAFFGRPVFHPNVNPVNGFACLWDHFSPRDTVVEAVCRLQRILTFDLFNLRADHVMQVDALTWIQDPGKALKLPLFCIGVMTPSTFDSEREVRHGEKSRSRKRLS